MHERVGAAASSSLAPSTSLALRRIGRRFESRGDDHAVEFFDHLFAHVGAAEPPGRDVRDREIGAEHDRRQRRQERQHRARLDQAGAERIDDDDLAVAHGLQQPRRAEAGGGIELERIGKIGIDPPQQHLGALQAGNGADEDAVVAHAQILAFDQQEPEIAREIGVLEIGFAHRSRRQQADVRVVLAAERRELGLEGLKERRDALDPRGAIDVGNGARQRQPVLDRVAGARWRLGAVAEHPPASVGAASDIDGIKAQMRAAGRRDADQRTQKFRIAGDQRGGQAAIATEPRRAVGVGEDGFEKLGALDEPGFQIFPFGRLDDQRHMAERPRPLDAGGILIDAIENAGAAQIAVGGGEAAIDLVGAERRQHGEERLPVRAHAAVAIHHLVENAGQRPVTRQRTVPGPRSRFRRRVSSWAAMAMFYVHAPQIEGGRIFERDVGAAERRSARRYGRDPGSARGGAPRPRRS